MGRENLELAKSFYSKISLLDCRDISEGTLQCKEWNHKPMQNSMTLLKSMIKCQVTPDEQLPHLVCLINYSAKVINHKGGAYVSVQVNLAHSQMTTHSS